MTTWTLVPAYGRDYTTQAAVLADWSAGKDFRVQDVSAGQDDGRYVNKPDLNRARLAGGVTQVKIRFKRLTGFVLIDVGPASEAGTFERVQPSGPESYSEASQD